ncbi:MAG: dTDP-4-dehydrorhamnose reductase [Henriciella sp.]|nr:dTDP-4-dehydrorhamnose reductase [Henriciella sp.]
MKILIAGRSGQLARSLVEIGAATHHTLYSVGRPELDLTNRRTISSALAHVKPDLIINAAAYTAVDRAEDEPESAYHVNKEGAYYLAAEARRAGLPIIHMSTDYVFDGSKNSPYLETDQTRPLGVYGKSKLAGEEAVRTENPRHVILRTAWVFSPFGNNFVKTMLNVAASREDITVVDNQYGNPTYALYLADGILSLCSRIEKSCLNVPPPWGTYHLAGLGQANWAELARAVFDESTQIGGPSARVQSISSDRYPTRTRRPINSCLSVDVVKRRWGIELPHWRLGVRDCVRRLVRQYEQD